MGHGDHCALRGRSPGWLRLLAAAEPPSARRQRAKPPAAPPARLPWHSSPCHSPRRSCVNGSGAEPAGGAAAAAAGCAEPRDGHCRRQRGGRGRRPCGHLPAVPFPYPGLAGAAGAQELARQRCRHTARREQRRRERRRSKSAAAHLQGEGGRLVAHVAADDVALDGKHPALRLHGCAARACPRRAEVAAPGAGAGGGARAA